MEELWKKFTLSEEEKGVLSVKSQDVARSKEQAQLNLLFKLQTNRDFNKEAFKSTIQQLWRGPQRITIKEVRNNLFLAIFEMKEHMNDILDKSPWSFDKRLVLLKCFTSDVSSENVTFQQSPFWIRVFNIPIKSMNSTVGIANEIGVPLLVDAANPEKPTFHSSSNSNLIEKPQQRISELSPSTPIDWVLDNSEISLDLIEVVVMDEDMVNHNCDLMGKQGEQISPPS